jgi:hypothetical protein
MASLRRHRGSNHIRWWPLLILSLTVGLCAAPAEGQEVQNCQPSQYLDRTAPGADRQLAWDFSIATDPERCMRVRVGQTVVWNGDLEVHPLGGQGGDMPNPITFAEGGSITFNSVGRFGFICLSHSSMKGAIEVVPGPCSAGFFGAGGMSPCAPCAAGTFSASAGATACTACAPGSFAAVQGSPVCQLCPAGTTAPDAGGVACIPCGAGFTANPARTACLAAATVPAVPPAGAITLGVCLVTAGATLVRRTRRS